MDISSQYISGNGYELTRLECSYPLGRKIASLNVERNPKTTGINKHLFNWFGLTIRRGGICFVFKKKLYTLGWGVFPHHGSEMFRDVFELRNGKMVLTNRL